MIRRSYTAAPYFLVPSMVELIRLAMVDSVLTLGVNFVLVELKLKGKEALGG
jgi:hypothetical protein